MISAHGGSPNARRLALVRRATRPCIQGRRKRQESTLSAGTCGEAVTCAAALLKMRQPPKTREMHPNEKRDNPQQTPVFADSLPFEVVSFDQAREALEEPPAGVQRLRRPGLADWLARRNPLTEAERRLSRHTTQWMLALPREIRPVELMRRYPRIANQLSAQWQDNEFSLHLLDELVLDRRGNRQGFPRTVAIELQALREHLQRSRRQATR
jgi:hypothetical protein